MSLWVGEGYIDIGDGCWRPHFVGDKTRRQRQDVLLIGPSCLDQASGKSRPLQTSAVQVNNGFVEFVHQ